MRDDSRPNDIDARRRRARRAASLVAGVLAAAVWVPLGGTSAAAASQPASAIGNESVRWIGVSPDYSTSGLVVVMSIAAQCTAGCSHLWATHDGGATWQRLAARDWQGHEPSMALAADGHVVLFARGSSTLQRSDDTGQSWHDAGPAGTPAVSPRFAADGSVAVAGGDHDWLVAPTGASAVPGSRGVDSDMSFMFSPDYPSAGTYAPVLLSAVDPHHATSLVLQCTAHLACDSPVALPPQATPAAATLVASPAYASDGTVFANLGTGLARSTDGGRTFVPLAVGRPTAEATATGMLVLDPGYRQGSGDEVVYVSILQLFHDPKTPPSGGVYRSSDGGATWSAMGSPGPPDGGATAVAVAPGGRVFAGFVQNGGLASGLVCWTGRAWAATCASTRAPSGAAAGSSPAPGTCTGASCSNGTTGGGTSRGDAGNAPAGNTGTSGGTGSTANVATTTTPGRVASIAVPVAVATLLAIAAAVRGAIGRRRRTVPGADHSREGSR